MRTRGVPSGVESMAAALHGMETRLAALERAARGASGGAVPWTALTLVNSWVDYGGGWQPAGYRRVGDLVSLRGLIRSGTMNSVISTLPVGFRPPAHLMFIQAASTPSVLEASRVSVYSSGVIQQEQDTGTPANDFLSLDGICFSLT